MSFYRAIATVGGLTLGSRLLGFVRDVMTASFLGAGPVADAFFIALKLPNFFRRITAEGAFSVSFVPMFSKTLAEHGPDEARSFAEEAQAVMLAVMLPFTIVCIVAMPWVLYVVAPGVHCVIGDDTACDPVRYDLALQFSRITFPYILMMSLTALLGGVLNSFGKFAAFAAAPMLFNGVLICALLFGTKIFQSSGHALAWGLAAAGVLQFVWMIYNYYSIGYVLKPRWPKLTPRIKKLFNLMIPGAVGAGAAQINLFIDMILASLLPVGSISFLYYADRLYQLPLGVIGVAIGTALLPMLTTALQSKDEGAAHRLFIRAFEAGLILGLPATFALIVLAPSIMDVLFVRGAFTVADSLQSAYALIAYAIGLPAFVLSRVFSVAFYARENTATPVKVAIFSAALNTAAALFLIYGTHMQHVGIALATGVTAWVNVGLLTYELWRKKFFYVDAAAWKRFFLIVIAVFGMSIVLYFSDHFVMPYILQGGQLLRFAGLGAVMAAGALVYGAFLYLAGILKLGYIRDLFPKRAKNAKPGDMRDLGQ